MSLLCLLQSNISVLVFWRYDNSNHDNYGGDNIIDGDKDTNGNGDSDNNDNVDKPFVKELQTIKFIPKLFLRPFCLNN